MPSPITIRVPKVKMAPTYKGFQTEQKQENRRVTGVTPKLLQAYDQSPARYLKRTSSLRLSGQGKKIKVGGIL